MSKRIAAGAPASRTRQSHTIVQYPLPPLLFGLGREILKKEEKDIQSNRMNPAEQQLSLQKLNELKMKRQLNPQGTPSPREKRWIARKIDYICKNTHAGRRAQAIHKVDTDLLRRRLLQKNQTLTRTTSLPMYIQHLPVEDPCSEIVSHMGPS